MAITVPGFPNTYQTEYARFPKAPLPGSLWEGELFQERPTGGLIAAVTEVAYTATITIGSFNASDTVGVEINGGLVIVTATTDADTTAGLLAAAINDAAFLDGVASATSAGAVVTLTGALGEELTTVEYSPDTTTATVLVTQEAVVQPQLCFGMGVVRDVPSTTVQYTKVAKPSSLTDVFAGVLVRTKGTELTRSQILASGYNPDYLQPGQVYTVMKENAGVTVEFTGNAPDESDDVYLIMTGADAGKWRSDDGGTSQVSTLTVTSVGADTLAFNYDGLPDLSLTATGTAADDADGLANLWNANAQYAAIGSAVGNGDGTLTITFADTSAHTFTDNSTGTSSIAENIDTAAVAATARLMEQLSWGRPSIPASADIPARAFLRLSNP
jgi:hypothetical protein